MLPPHLRHILKQIEKTIDKANSRADDRNKSASEAQREVAVAVQALTNEFNAYEKKQENAESGKRRRENWTIGSLFATALVTVALAVIGTLQACILEKTDHTLKDTLATNQAVQRAFINVSELKQESILDGKSWRMTPIIKNSGVTTAVDVSIVLIRPKDEWMLTPSGLTPFGYSHISWKDGAPRDPEPLLDDLKITGLFRVSGLTIGPQGGLTAGELTTEIASDDLIMNTSNGRLGRFIYGSIRYADIFDKRHTSKFCFRIDGALIRHPGSTPAEPVQSVCAHWNCTDDYCYKDKEAYENEVRQIIEDANKPPPRPPFPPTQPPPAPPK